MPVILKHAQIDDMFLIVGTDVESCRLKIEERRQRTDHALSL
jgi:hypothetical protein